MAHAKLRIGDSMIEIGAVHGPFPPMPSLLNLYVEDADANCRRALRAGAASFPEPAGTCTQTVQPPSRAARSPGFSANARRAPASGTGGGNVRAEAA